MEYSTHKAKHKKEIKYLSERTLRDVEISSICLTGFPVENGGNAREIVSEEIIDENCTEENEDWNL